MAELEPLQNIAGVKLSSEQQKIVNEWKGLLNGHINPCFEDGEFLNLFLNNVPKEQQIKYVINTTKYETNHDQCEKKYVLVFRRSTPTKEPKPEIFWSTEFGIPLFGLKKEQPLHSERRIKSHIWVSTIESILENGNGDGNERISQEYGDVASDGEIRINDKPYNKNKCLFIYKPQSEKQELEEFLKNEEEEFLL